MIRSMLAPPSLGSSQTPPGDCFLSQALASSTAHPFIYTLPFLAIAYACYGEPIACLAMRTYSSPPRPYPDKLVLGPPRGPICPNRIQPI